MVTLYNAQEQANLVAELTAQYLGIPTPKVEFQPKARRGYAYGGHSLVTIPGWPVSYGEHYFNAYVVHEVVHLYRFSKKTWGEKSHGPEFHADERRALKEWGLVPKYARAYVKELRTLQGDVVFDRPWSKKKAVLAPAAPVKAIEVRAVRTRKPTALEIILGED